MVTTRTQALVGVIAVLGMLLAACTSPPAVDGSNPATSAPTAIPVHYDSVDAMLAAQPFYVAHRGGSADWPEYSMTAYENAANWGMGALEVSVARTSDGQYFGLHDSTLDRTSQVTGNIDPGTLTWDELRTTYQNKLNASSPAGVDYTLVTDVFERFARDHVIFVDTKYIGGSTQRQELVDMMLSVAPAEHWVLKGYYDDRNLAQLAKSAGIASWGYYYAKDLPKLNETAHDWDMLGLDLAATNSEWAQIKSMNKPVIAFFIDTKAQVSQALAKGANGLMVSGVRATLGTPRIVAGSSAKIGR